MPTYTFRCVYCGNARDVVRKIVLRDDPEQCDCGQMMERTIEPALPIPDLDYVDHDLDSSPIRITSRRQLREEMRNRGVVEKFGKGWW